MPLDLEFVGDFFNLADFFHSVKRFVSVANANVRVSGRLITVEGVQLEPATPSSSRKLKAEIKATIYLSPKARGHDRRRHARGPGHRRDHAGEHAGRERGHAGPGPDRHRDPLTKL